MSWENILKNEDVIPEILKTFYDGFERIMNHIEKRNIMAYRQDGFKTQFRPMITRQFDRLKQESEIDQLKAIFGYGVGRRHPSGAEMMKGLEGYFDGVSFVRWVVFAWNVQYVPFEVMENEENAMLGRLFVRCIRIAANAGFPDISTLIEAYENR